MLYVSEEERLLRVIRIEVANEIDVRLKLLVDWSLDSQERAACSDYSWLLITSVWSQLPAASCRYILHTQDDTSSSWRFDHIIIWGLLNKVLEFEQEIKFQLSPHDDELKIKVYSGSLITINSIDDVIILLICDWGFGIASTQH